MYLVKENFKFKNISLKVGDVLDPAKVMALDEKLAPTNKPAFDAEDQKKLLAAGIIVKQADAALKQIADLDSVIAKKKAEIAELQDQSKALKEKSPPKDQK